MNTNLCILPYSNLYKVTELLEKLFQVSLYKPERQAWHPDTSPSTQFEPGHGNVIL